MTNTLAFRVAIAGCVGIVSLAHAQLGDEWQTNGGQWRLEREVQLFVRQTQLDGTAVALLAQPSGADGAWRVLVEPSLGAQSVGLCIASDATLDRGLLLTLGPTGAAGCALRTVDGSVLWADKWAPWCPYNVYVLEAVVEGTRARVQMFEWDAKTLVSQSPWVDVPPGALGASAGLGLYARDSVARFWAWEKAKEPLSPIVPDAPNKRRLVQGDDSPWRILGTGTWMWTTSEKRRVRQLAQIGRSSAINTSIRGTDRLWECRVRVSPGAGGAGMMFACNEDGSDGFVAWLGGTQGAGTLMLYRLPPQALWSGEQDNWHYDTDYILRAWTEEGTVRAQLLDAASGDVLQETDRIPMLPREQGREGSLGFNIWLGSAEFWGFSEATAGDETPTNRPAIAGFRALGNGWLSVGDGDWAWTPGDPVRLTQTGDPVGARAINPAIAGIMGKWRCRVRPQAGAKTAGLLFQASSDLEQGFAVIMTPDGASLVNLAGRTLWQNTKLRWSPGQEYMIQGTVTTDRVSATILAADGTTVLAQSPDVYVPDTNNHRRGSIGALLEGPAELWGWELEPE